MDDDKVTEGDDEMELIRAGSHETYATDSDICSSSREFIC